ncbi:cysteine desulfurase, partial [Patescibacteria group bacterium]|nr:cysteine desulfurase [Patescibacteria group bacterium]
LDPQVQKAMEPFHREIFANPSSQHKMGLEAKMAVDKARKSIAEKLNCQSSEIIFCASGTEANNIAIQGIARANIEKGNHLITTKIEHKSVLNVFAHLEKEGFRVTYLDVNKDGLINPEDLKSAITDQTILVSIIYANNEIGVIEPIKELGEICKKAHIPLHTDACQAAPYLSLDTKELNIDLLSLNGSKIYGPKGSGALFIKDQLKLSPIIFGGNQENGLRSGTHNTAGIIGLATALELCEKFSHTELENLRNHLLQELLQKIPKATLNGSLSHRLPNNINISIPNINGKELLFQLSEKGIMASTGSACSAKKASPSHVLLALGLSKELVEGSLRLSLGRYTTEKEIQYAIEEIPKIIKHLIQ